MKLFVLIMYVSSGPITTQEFNSLESCENARQTIQHAIGDYKWIHTACVEK